MPTSKIKLFLLIPLVAALLVYGSTFSYGGSSATVKAKEAKSTEWTPLSKRDAQESLIPSMTQIGTVLTGILILATGCILLMRRLQSKAVVGLGNEIRIKETRRMSSKRALHLLCAGDRLLLLVETEHGIGLLSDLTPKDEEERGLGELAENERRETETGAVPRDLVIPPVSQGETKKRRALGSFKDLMSRMGT